jgi:hypothetical protein
LDLLSPDVLCLQGEAIAQDARFSFVLRHGELHDWVLGPLAPKAFAIRPQVYDKLLGT